MSTVHWDARLRGVRVLVVDDDADARELASILLLSSGATSWSVSSVREALTEIDARHYDVVVTDISMPGESGIDLLHSLRRLGDGTPVIAHTALAAMHGKDYFPRLGFTNVVPKPYDAPVLIDAVIDAASSAHERRSDDGESVGSHPTRSS